MASLKTIRTYAGLIEAESARSYLEAHNIEATMPDRHALYHQPHIIGILGGVRLQVKENQFEEAERLLSEIERRSHLTPVDSHDPTPLHIENRQKSSVKWLARVIALGVVLYWIFEYWGSYGG